jgi:hypothetical protein
MTSSSFSRLAVVTASTKRSPTISGGKRGDPVTNVASLTCTPLDPVDAEVRQRLMLDSPNIILETFVQASVDIQVGDTLVVGSTEYPIKALEDWYWPPDQTTYRHVFVEKLKP